MWKVRIIYLCKLQNWIRTDLIYSWFYLVSAEMGLLLTEMEPRLAIVQATDSVKIPPWGRTRYEDIRWMSTSTRWWVSITYWNLHKQHFLVYSFSLFLNYSGDLKSNHSKPRIFENQISISPVFKGLGFSFCYSYGPNHLKTWPFGIPTFWSKF